MMAPGRVERGVGGGGDGGGSFEREWEAERERVLESDRGERCLRHRKEV